MSKASADKWFSWAVRERAQWTCEKCGIQFRPPTSQLQCSHLFSRKHNISRWHPDNAFAHCASCHAWLESRPPEFAAWARERLGGKRYEELRRYHNQVVNFRKSDFDAIAAHYRSEYKRLEDVRLTGVSGWIQIENHQQGN